MLFRSHDHGRGRPIGRALGRRPQATPQLAQGAYHLSIVFDRTNGGRWPHRTNGRFRPTARNPQHGRGSGNALGANRLTRRGFGEFLRDLGSASEPDRRPLEWCAASRFPPRNRSPPASGRARSIQSRAVVSGKAADALDAVIRPCVPEPSSNGCGQTFGADDLPSQPAASG